MPTVLVVGPYRFHFYSDERGEPPHIHVQSAERRAKYWLKPIRLAKNGGFRSDELKEIERLILENLELLLRTLNVFFAS